LFNILAAKNAAELIDILRSGRVDRLAVDAIYAAYHSDALSAPDVIFRDVVDSGTLNSLII